MLRKKGFEIYSEQPPKKVNHGIDWNKIIEAVKGKKLPGTWFVIGEWEKPTARQMRCRLSQEFEGMDFQSHVDKGTKASKLYCRVPPK